MSHRIRKRHIFALLDNRLSPRAAKNLDRHLKSCAPCAEYLSRITKYRDLVRDLPQQIDPNWTRIDAGIERVVREVAGAENRFALHWIPVTLTLAATVFVALAIISPQIRRWSISFSNETAPKVAREQQTVTERGETSLPRLEQVPVRLTAFVSDSLQPETKPRVGESLRGGSVMRTTGQGGLRVEIENTALIEVKEETELEIVSLNEVEPTVSLHQGKILIARDVSGTVQGRGIVVLAGGDSFEVVTGTAEFHFEGFTPWIDISDGGTVLAHRGFDTRILEGGSWRIHAPLSGYENSEWLEVNNSDRLSTIAPEGEQSEIQENKKIGRLPTGTLPRQLVKEAWARATPRIRECYENALKRDPTLVLTVETRLRIGRKGEVVWVRTSGLKNVPKLRDCVEAVLKQTEFIAPQNGSVELVFPLRLYPKF